MPIIRRSNCIPLPIVVCPVVAVVMLESGGELCALCGECCLHSRQHPDDGHKDARNMLRYY